MTFLEFKEKYQKIDISEESNACNTNPVVSIIVQTYSQEKYIEECLNGIVNQKTSFPIEIIIGEDCSPDKTREICLKYASKFPKKIRLLLHHRENQIKIFGEPTSNFNAIYNFYSAKGKYIAFCEGDDVWTDQMKLQKQIDYLESNTKYSFTYHSYKTVNAMSSFEKSDEEKNQPMLDINCFNLKTCKYHPLLLTICFRNNLQQIPVEMINVINVDSFLISLLGNYGEAKFMDSVEASLYRKHTEGIWSHRVKEKKNKAKILTYKNLHKFYLYKDDIRISKYFKNLVLNTYKSLIYLHLKNLDFLKGLSSMNDYLKFSCRFDKD